MFELFSRRHGKNNKKSNRSFLKKKINILYKNMGNVVGSIRWVKTDLENENIKKLQNLSDQYNLKNYKSISIRRR